MRRWVAALATIAILTAPAYAQRHGKGAKGPDPQTEQKKKRDAEAEKAYKSAVDRIPDKKYDPWGGVR
jgi:hypothetical protein